MQTEDTATRVSTPYAMETVCTMGKQAFKRNTRIARPFLVAYRKSNNRWYLYGAKTLEEAENKIAGLLHRKATKMCILANVMYDAALPIDESKEQTE